jgi:hypothetical protein
MAISTFLAVKPLLSGPGLTVAIDDKPTPSYGPEVEGAATPDDALWSLFVPFVSDRMESSQRGNRPIS